MAKSKHWDASQSGGMVVETVVAIAIAPEGIRIRHQASGEYTEDAVIGEVVGELVRKIRNSGENHYGYTIQLHFERDGKKFSIMD